MANTDERLKAFLEKAEKATPGPWRGMEKGNSIRSFSVKTVAFVGEPAKNICSGISPKTEDCQFIVEARTEAPFAAQEAIKARDALRRIRDVCNDVCNPETPFTRAVSKPVLKAMVDLIDKVLAD